MQTFSYFSFFLQEKLYIFYLLFCTQSKRTRVINEINNLNLKYKFNTFRVLSTDQFFLVYFFINLICFAKIKFIYTCKIYQSTINIYNNVINDIVIRRFLSFASLHLKIITLFFEQTPEGRTAGFIRRTCDSCGMFACERT